MLHKFLLFDVYDRAFLIRIVLIISIVLVKLTFFNTDSDRIDNEARIVIFLHVDFGLLPREKLRSKRIDMKVLKSRLQHGQIVKGSV